MLRINPAKDDVKECFSSDHLRIIFRTLIRDLRIFFEVLRHLALTSKLTNIEICLYLVMDFLLSRQNCNMYKYDAYFLRTRKVHLWFQLLLYLGFFFPSLVGFLCVQKTVVDLLLILVISLPCNL